mmetsp:Transcript_5107/g.20339  ORF Transcript_5107/g.20339 Transcript_5107/m.20339 type:complete len:250 (-) Transcript_5107:384-1133(-)
MELSSTRALPSEYMSRSNATTPQLTTFVLLPMKSEDAGRYALKNSLKTSECPPTTTTSSDLDIAHLTNSSRRPLPLPKSALLPVLSSWPHVLGMGVPLASRGSVRAGVSASVSMLTEISCMEDSTSRGASAVASGQARHAVEMARRRLDAQRTVDLASASPRTAFTASSWRAVRPAGGLATHSASARACAMPVEFRPLSSSTESRVANSSTSWRKPLPTRSRKPGGMKPLFHIWFHVDSPWRMKTIRLR